MAVAQGKPLKVTTSEIELISSLPSQLGLWNTQTVSLQKRKTLPNESPGYDTKQSNGEAPVMPEL